VSLRPKLRPERTAAARPAVKTHPNVPDAQVLVDEAKLGGKVAYAVVDADTGSMMETRNSATGFAPASVTKAVTALYAINTLGATYRFRTRLIATGPIEDGVIKGDLVLAGGGDPTLDTNALADMAAKLKAAGIKGVTGKFRVFEKAIPYIRMIDATQPDHVGYNPSISGLNLNYNRVHFQWKRSAGKYHVTMDARSNKYRPEVRVARISVTDRKVPVYTYKDAGDHDKWTVARSALGKAGTRWLPVRRPGDYAGEVFATFARSHGIQLKIGKKQLKAPKGTAVVTHRSVTLHVILKGMLRYSNNLTAEVVGMTATVARIGKVASMRASAREMSIWASRELGMKDAALVDHSGLGDASRLSAQSLARALAKVSGDGVLAPMLKAFTMRHENGKVNASHPIKVSAKTGTLYFVSTLAGYAVAPNGKRLAFAIFSSSVEKRKSFDKSTPDRPPGASAWNKRAKRLQQKLIERWSTIYAG